ncbi:hypothetical protein F3K20_16320 [Streptomyces scabiei]|nr:hypothetical protein [Streptomyces sp. LBUM 1477]MBP5883713.1 hypothetical protein [Streptomyces sp. LBUM 1487]QTU46227.1 hypothetical protein F3K20_16320 [Streptomyces sp. LBUM 1482]QTU62216.1 hypothetical protein F3K22_15275 [Streptomyces sp. LBUM 1475]
MPGAEHRHPVRTGGEVDPDPGLRLPHLHRPARTGRRRHERRVVLGEREDHPAALGVVRLHPARAGRGAGARTGARPRGPRRLRGGGGRLVRLLPRRRLRALRGLRRGRRGGGRGGAPVPRVGGPDGQRTGRVVGRTGQHRVDAPPRHRDRRARGEQPGQ